MEIGFVGLGRMGFNMTLRLLQGGHRVAACDLSAERVTEAAGHGAVAAPCCDDTDDTRASGEARTAQPPPRANGNGRTNGLKSRSWRCDVYG